MSSQETIVDICLSVLLGRNGFDDWWYGIDVDINVEIIKELRDEVSKCFGKLRKDDNGFWYLLPQNMTDTFYDDLNKINLTPYGSDKRYALENMFYDLYDKYYLRGGSQHLDVFMENKDEEE
jgi:hypothetical protein